MYKDIINPVLDRVLGFVLLFILFPVLLVISIVILCHLRSFPFYIQSRPGHNEKIFNLIKFKTMRDAKEIDEDSLLDYKRTTKLGSILRKLSISVSFFWFSHSLANFPISNFDGARFIDRIILAS